MLRLRPKFSSGNKIKRYRTHKNGETNIMRYYPQLENKGKEIHSITWSGKHGAYILSSDGIDIGDIIVSRHEWHQIMNFDFSSLKELGFDNTDLYSITGYTDSGDMTGIEEVKVNVTKRVSGNSLPFGVFKLVIANDGILMIPFKTNLENTNIVKNKNLKDLVKEFFINGMAGRKNKKGFLLYGPPGNGKTTEVMSLFDICDEMEVRIFLVDAEMDLSYIQGAQELLEKDRSIFIMEEITERTVGRKLEHLLTFLDGENSWDNAVVIATTNYPEDLPSNLVDRPGRFDTFIEYGNPTKSDIINLGEKFGLTEEQILPLTGRGFSFDYCSFIMATANKNSATVKKTITSEEAKRSKISSTFKGKMGLSND